MFCNWLAAQGISYFSLQERLEAGLLNGPMWIVEIASWKSEKKSLEKLTDLKKNKSYCFQRPYRVYA
jgi:hypothetical protein